MGIHGLLFVHIHFAQALIARQCPDPLVGLEVAAKLRVVAGFFDDFAQMKRPPQHVFTASRLGKLRQGIHREGLSINALVRGRRVPAVGQHPIHAPKFFVPEMAEDIVVSASGGLQIALLSINGECLRECPQDAGVEDQALIRLGVDHQMVRNLAAKAAKLLVNRVLEPEGKDVGPQLLFDTSFQIRHTSLRWKVLKRSLDGASLPPLSLIPGPSVPASRQPASASPPGPRVDREESWRQFRPSDATAGAPLLDSASGTWRPEYRRNLRPRHLPGRAVPLRGWRESRRWPTHRCMQRAR